MKVIIQMFIYVVSSYCLYANGIVKLDGRISETYNGCEVALNYRGQTNSTTTTIVRNGRFQLVTKLLNDFELVYLIFKHETKTMGVINFFAAPGKIMINVTAKEGLISMKDISLANAAFVKEKKSYEAMQMEIEDTLSLLFNKLSSLKKEKLPNRNYDSLLTIYHSKQRSLMDQQIAFIKTHSNKYISLYYFHEVINTTNFFFYPVDTLLQIFNDFNAQLRSTALGQITLNYLLKRNSLLLQSVMPDFTLKTHERKNFQLSSFRGKQYVLLCFWDSWCGPCIKSFPILREIDSLFSKKGLQMISISIDSDSTKWINSLKRYKLPWLQGCDLVPYVQQDKTLRSLYNVRVIPQYFLVNKEGRLIYHNIQSNDKDDFSVLQSLLNNIFR